MQVLKEYAVVEKFEQANLNEGPSYEIDPQEDDICQCPHQSYRANTRMQKYNYSFALYIITLYNAASKTTDLN